MHLMLLWLALPLAVGPLVARNGRGSATARILLAGLVLAAFWQGVGTLDPGDLRAVASTAPEDARFVAFTAGAGLVLLATRREDRWITRVLGWPLAGALVLCAAVGSLAAALAGVAAMTLPWFVGGAVARRGRPVTTWDREPVPRFVEGVLIVGATLAVGWWSPFAAICLAVTGLAWWVWAGGRRAARFDWPVIPVATTALLAVAGWLVLTIAESPLVTARGASATAPISPAASVLVGLLVLAAALVVASPWPAHLLRRSVLTLPAAVLLAHAARVMVPDGTDHWLPLLGALAVVSWIGALLTGTPLLALAALAVLGGAAADRASLIAAIVLAACVIVLGTGADRHVAPWRHRFPMSALVVSGAAIASMVVIRGVMVTQVVWGIVLVLSGVIAARAADTSVAPH